MQLIVSNLPYASEEDHSVAERYIIGDIWSENKQDSVCHNQDRLGCDDERHPPADAVGEVRAQNGCDGAACIGRCGEQLCSCGGVAHVADDLNMG